MTFLYSPLIVETPELCHKKWPDFYLKLSRSISVKSIFITVGIIDPMQIQKQVGIYRDDREREITTGQTPIQQEIISSSSSILNNLSPTNKNEELFPEEFPSSAGKHILTLF